MDATRAAVTAAPRSPLLSLARFFSAPGSSATIRTLCACTVDVTARATVSATLGKRMVRVQLLEVADSFVIKGRGVVLVPDFDVPDSWQNCEEPVLLQYSNGESALVDCEFQLTHFNISNPDHFDRRWRITAVLQSAENVPTGTTLSCSPELATLLKPA